MDNVPQETRRMTMTATKEEMNLLLATFDAADKDWIEKKAATAVALQVRSDAVKALGVALSPHKKFRLRGEEVTIVCRSTNKGASETWYLKGKSDKNEDLPELG